MCGKHCIRGVWVEEPARPACACGAGMCLRGRHVPHGALGCGLLLCDERRAGFPRIFSQVGRVDLQFVIRGEFTLGVVIVAFVQVLLMQCGKYDLFL